MEQDRRNMLVNDWMECNVDEIHNCYDAVRHMKTDSAKEHILRYGLCKGLQLGLDNAPLSGVESADDVMRRVLPGKKKSGLDKIAESSVAILDNAIWRDDELLLLLLVFNMGEVDVAEAERAGFNAEELDALVSRGVLEARQNGHNKYPLWGASNKGTAVIEQLKRVPEPTLKWVYE